LKSKQAISTCDKIIELFKSLPDQARKTLTLDNGGEFSKHMNVVNALGLQSFFVIPTVHIKKAELRMLMGAPR